MGLEIKRKDGKYQMKSTISDERLHDEKWISEDEAKKVLIERAYCKFLEEAVKIDMEFPSTYSINGKREKSVFTKEDGYVLQNGKVRFGEWWLKHHCELKPLFEKYEELSKRLNLDLTLE